MKRTWWIRDGIPPCSSLQSILFRSVLLYNIPADGIFSDYVGGESLRRTRGPGRNLQNFRGSRGRRRRRRLRSSLAARASVVASQGYKYNRAIYVRLGIGISLSWSGRRRGKATADARVFPRPAGRPGCAPATRKTSPRRPSTGTIPRRHSPRSRLHPFGRVVDKTMLIYVDKTSRELYREIAQAAPLRRYSRLMKYKTSL